ncbi:MAG: cell division protein ZapA [Elusimicrobia bacterium]|nr:cell division protein ZapA [Elusimicrobiota bacterium]
MARQGVPIEIRRRKFELHRTDLDELTIHAVAQKVEKRLLELEATSGIIDSSKLGILLALDIACDMEKLQGRLDHGDQGLEARLETMIVALEKGLAPAKKP